MAIARFKDLCIDVSDAQLTTPFWAAVLGLDPTFQDDGSAVLRGGDDAQTVWINPVPEPRTVKQRVHLDVLAASVDDVKALGATQVPADDEFAWTVMADPEGGEFCVFVREEVAGYRLYELVVDCVDPTPVARWWAELLGGRLVEDPRGFAYVEAIPGAPFASLDFVPVPEPKTVKNRIHWDVTASSLDAVLEAGATQLRARDAELGWTVLADPEGNEFCVFSEVYQAPT